MKRAPKIGDRVKYKGHDNCGPITGTVMAIYPTDTYDSDGEWLSANDGPEHEWHVGIKVDVVPTPWPYPGTDRIAPCISDLERA